MAQDDDDDDAAAPPPLIRMAATKPLSSISNTTVYLDGQFYSNMQFENCELVYSGGALPVLIGNQFVNCVWRLDGPAGQTLDFLKLVVAIGGKDLVIESLGLAKGYPDGN